MRRRCDDAFGSTATDVSAFSLNLAQKGTEKHALKNHTMQLFFKNLCNFPWCIWLGSHRCFSVLAKKKNVVFSWNFVFFCSIFWIFAFVAHSNGSAATDVSAFWQSHFLQRDFEAGNGFYNGIWKKMVEKPKKCNFTTRFWGGQRTLFSGNVVNSL